MLQVIRRIPIYTRWTEDGIPIYGFGLMLCVAYLLCIWLAGRRAEREGIAKEHIQDLAIWLFVGGLLGARLTFLAHRPPPGGLWGVVRELPRIWDGGIVLYGSILGGLAAYGLAYLLVFRRHNLSTWKLADVIAPSFAVGLCLGRMGCFLNGCCFGQVACADCAVYAVEFPLSAPAREALVEAGAQTAAGFTIEPGPVHETRGVQVGLVNPRSPAWASGLRPGDVITEVNGKSIAQRTADDGRTFFPTQALEDSFRDWRRGDWTLDLTVLPKGEGEPEHRITFKPRTLGLYPTQPYEVVSMLLLFLLLTAYYPLRHRPGQVMAVLMMGYAAHRYLNEALRDDPRPIDFERYSSVALFLAGLGMWLWLQFQPSSATPGATAAPPASAPAGAPGPAAAVPSGSITSVKPEAATGGAPGGSAATTPS
jgi:prolipoprotein diacylglyceryltransferase